MRYITLVRAIMKKHDKGYIRVSKVKNGQTVKCYQSNTIVDHAMIAELETTLLRSNIPYKIRKVVSPYADCARSYPDAIIVEVPFS